MKNYLLLFLAFIALSISAFKPLSDDNKKKDKEPEGIKWMTIQQAEAKSKKNPKKIFIDVYTDWCGWCKKMDKNTFSDPKIAEYVNKNYYAVKLDAETKEDIVLNGKTYKYNTANKVNDLAVELLQGKMGYPCTVYLDEKFNMLAPVMGYLEVKPFDNLIRYYGDNKYKTQSFEEFEASRK